MLLCSSDVWDEAQAQELRAALASMDDWDGELTALFSTDGESDCRQTPTKTKRPYARPRAAWKKEMAAIREGVKAVEKDIAAGKSTKLSADRVIENEWEELAKAQEARRVAAEMENAKLRKRAESQMKLVTHILGLTKRVKVLEDALWVPPPMSFDNYMGPRIDSRVQMWQLDGMVNEAPEIFSTDKFTGVAKCFRDLRFQDGPPTLEGVVIEFHAAWMLPFELGRVADALWLQTNRPTFEDRETLHRDLYEDTSSIVTQFLSTAGPRDWWGGIHGTSAARRVLSRTEDGSVLIVATTHGRAYIRASCRGSARVESWFHIERMNFEDQAESQPITRILWYRRTWLGPPPDSALTKIERLKWSHTVTATDTRSRFQQDLDWSVQAIDNLLLTPTAIQRSC